MPKAASVYFVDGLVKAKDWIIVAAEFQEWKEEGDFSRGFSLKAGTWGRFDFPDMGVRSIAALPAPARGTFFLGKDGHIVLIVPEGRKSEQITDAGTGPGKLGYVNLIRVIGGAFYVCGTKGQVYRRTDAGWVHFDEGVRNPADGAPAPDLYGLDGSSADNIYAVGENAAVWRFDGSTWRRELAPARDTLRWVRTFVPDRVFACGRNGTFLRRTGTEWESLSDPRIRTHFWCLEEFEGNIYLAGADGLYRYDGKALKPIDTGLTPKLDGNRLYANDGVLWSIGMERLGFFDGKKWTYVKHPDNPE
jgi:hypothetical protein